jgi:tetraacyldisaccharide 4'-kinase
MREPAFWWRPGSGGLLRPLASAYGAIAALRMRSRGTRAGVPVICLGNLTVGGAGKTPAALAVAELLLAAQQRPFFLSRGYGGRLPGPVRVDPGSHHAADVGDEPLMLARVAPTIVARDRVVGAKIAEAGGASVVVMDDGFQNPSLDKTLAIVLVDGGRGIGNGRTIPAGPLRAPLDIQMARAQALVVVGPPLGAASIVDAANHRGIAVFRARLEPDADCLAALRQRRVLAFSGIGNPGKFFATLAAAGVAVAARAGFADHHRYTSAQAQALIARAEAEKLALVTTEKDLARLVGEPALAALAARCIALPVRLVVREHDVFRQMIANAVTAAEPGQSAVPVRGATSKV